MTRLKTIQVSLMTLLVVTTVALSASTNAFAAEKINVSYRLTKWKVVELSDTQKVKSLTKTVKQLGCEVKQDDHGGHVDVSYRCPQWRKISLKTHKSAHSWEKWLKASGFETRHKEGHDGHDHGGHDHPSEGPHHGHLIELGQENYHAEMVHNEKTGQITIYVLDGAAKVAVPVDAKELRINLKLNNRGRQYKLAAVPDQKDPAGMSSRFVTNDKQLGKDLHIKGVNARLVVKIRGKSFVGKINHNHDHNHDHDH